MTCPQRCDCSHPYDCLYTQQAHTPSYALVWIIGAAFVAVVLVLALW